MKKLYLFVVLFCCINEIGNAQSPNWQWAESTRGSWESYGESICTDAFGHIYVTGGFDGAATFGSDTLNGGGCFLVKYDFSGAVLWAKGIGGGAGHGICTDNVGNVYIIGEYYNSEMVFGSDTLKNNLLGYNNIFVAKFDTAGSVVWAKNAGADSGTTLEVHGNSICADAWGNVYITGYFLGSTIVFGNDTLPNNDSYASNPVFIAKYNSSGNVLWAKISSDSGSVYPSETGSYVTNVSNSVTTDLYGNVYITGSFSSPTITFGNYFFLNNSWYGTNFELEFNPLLNYAPNLFLVQYDTSGTVLWASQSYGGSGEGNGVSTDVNGNIYLTGEVYGPGIDLGNIYLDSIPGAFLAQFNSSGDVIWAESILPTAGAFSGTCLKANANGNTYVTGLSKGIYESNKFFIAKFDELGNMIWAKNAGEADGNGNSNSICFDTIGDVYTTGYFGGDVTDTNLILGTDTLTATKNNYKYFIAKIDTTISTGIPNINNPASSIQIYPNPSPTTFCFSGINESATIQIFNVLGEMVFSSIANSSNYWLNLNGQAKGTYFYRITDNSNFIQQSGKIVLE